MTDIISKSRWMPLDFRLKHFIRIVLVLSAPIQAGAQQLDTLHVKPNNGYIASYWKNGIALLTSPVHWRGDDWAKLGGTIAITSVIVSMDEPVSQPFFNWQTNVGTKFGDAGRFMGNSIPQFSISALALGAGLAYHNKPLQHFALDNMQAQLFTAGLTVFVKELAHRERPIEGNGAYKWHGPFHGSGNESFFSGHTSISFCTATMIYLHSHKKWWVGVISYGLASGVAVSRLQTQQHWASDVVMGAVIGSSVAKFIYSRQEKRREAIKAVKIIP